MWAENEVRPCWAYVVLRYVQYLMTTSPRCFLGFAYDPVPCSASTVLETNEIPVEYRGRSRVPQLSALPTKREGRQWMTRKNEMKKRKSYNLILIRVSEKYSLKTR